MSQVKINIDNHRTAFSPGETVPVQLEWDLDQDPGTIILNFFWFTKGHGNREFELAQSETIEDPGTFGKTDFEFSIPPMPYSFQGKYFSLDWAFDVELSATKETFRQEITVGPGEESVILKIAQIENPNY